MFGIGTNIMSTFDSFATPFPNTAMIPRSSDHLINHPVEYNTTGNAPY